MRRRLVTARTRVELMHLEGKIENWIRFGKPVKEEILDRRRRAFWFDAGAIFAYVRWASNDYGTVVSRIDIVRCCAANEPVTSIPGIRPGGEILLRLAGWPEVEQVLQTIDQVEALGIDPVEACPDHWRHVHNRLSARKTPRGYSTARHRVWLMRRELHA